MDQNFSAVAAAVDDGDARLTAFEGLQCSSVESGARATAMKAQCPTGSPMTGVGCSARNTSAWIATSAPVDSTNEWLCSVGGGPGNANAIAQCCEY